jgi:hypothetical protein
MKEAYEIGQKIIRHIEKETYSEVEETAKAYLEIGDEKGIIKKVWLLNKIDRSHRRIGNITGFVTGTEEGANKYLKDDGETMSKKSPLGLAIQEIEGLGTVELHGNHKIAILKRSNYKRNREGDDAIEAELIIRNNEIVFADQSLKSKLEELYLLLQKEEALDKNDDLEKVAMLQEEIERTKREIQEKSIQGRRYIRTTASLKEQFLLGPQQVKLMQKKVLNGPLIINGGPGTGKTTLLIQRIDFLKQKETQELESFPVLAKHQLDQLNKANSWTFYSPSELLREYLRNAMNAENLQATNDTLRTWEQQRNAFKSQFGLIGIEHSPFLSFNGNYNGWSLTGSDVKKLNNSFSHFYLTALKRRIDRVLEIDAKSYTWYREVMPIMGDLAISDFKLPVVIKRLESLKSQFGDLLNLIDSEYKDLIGKEANRIQAKFNEEDTEAFLLYLKSLRNNVIPDEEDAGEEDEGFDDENVLAGKKNIDLNNLIKRIIRTKSLAIVDSKRDINKKYKDLLTIIEAKGFNEATLKAIGDKAMFLTSYRPLLRGADSFILSQFIRLYKQFRRSRLNELPVLNSKQKRELDEILKIEPKNSRIHNDELDLLIYFILHLARQFYQIDRKLTSQSTNRILSEYLVYMKPIIGIDEATDFTTVQLACMYELSIPDINSVTLCGDMMQQMNENGMKNWSDLKKVMPNVEIGELSKSYRQTPKLIKLAKALFEKRYGFTPNFEPADENIYDEPDPLFFQNELFENRMNWIAERITEIYTNYDNQIPNIAIFAKDEEDVRKIANELSYNTKLQDKLIKVRACIGNTDIGSADLVRVFDIKMIKGMEFEAVFFADVDSYLKNEIKLLDKLLYVGLSRARYYLGITLTDDFPDSILPIKSYLMDSTWNQRKHYDY